MRVQFPTRLACAVACLILSALCLAALVPAPANASPRVRNIILMVADGSGFNHVQAASLYRHGRPDALVYQRFPVRLAMGTFSAHASGATAGYDPFAAWAEFRYFLRNATDSAASGTAMACGVKTYNSAIGVGLDHLPVENVLERAEDLGMATGVVTTVPFSHATPAAFVAHQPDRGAYADIARQMLTESLADVIIGCGHPLYSDDGSLAPEDKRDHQFVGGQETWEALAAGKLTGERGFEDADGDGTDDSWTLVETPDAFRRVIGGSAPATRLCGVPRARSTLQQARSGDSQADPYAVAMNPGLPDLALLTQAALAVLGRDRDGFALMVEGGAVDWAAHGHQAGRLIEEELSFEQAVAAVVRWVERNSNWDETVLLVTADHETGGLWGPGTGGPEDDQPVFNPLESRGRGHVPGLEWHTGGHTNSLVPLFAMGSAAKALRAHVVGRDRSRGPYIDNTGLASFVFRRLGPA